MTADDRRPVPPAPLHPDLDTLADLHADALDRSTAERVRQHVRTCARCAQTLAALDSVGSRLRALPDPPIPAAVAARLDATLADLRRAEPVRPRPVAPAGPAGPATGPRERIGEPVEPRSTGAPERVADLARARDRRQRRRARLLGSVAAAAAVLAGAASVTAIVRAGGGSDNADTAAAGAAPDSATEQLPSVLPSAPGVAVSIPSYDRESLRADLPRIQQSAAGIITGRTSEAGVMADPARRTACANTIRGTSGRLLGVLRITYEGDPAYVFVFTDGSRRSTYVVSEDCGTSPALPAAVLDTVS
jgi:hypothetical protein